MKNDFVKRQDVYEMLNNIGGCNAADEYFKGWDAAIDGAINELEKLPSMTETLTETSERKLNIRQIIHFLGRKKYQLFQPRMIHCFGNVSPNVSAKNRIK